MTNSRKIYRFIFAIFLFFPANFIFAQALKSPLKDEYSTISNFLKAILDIVIYISIPIIVFMIVYSGFLFVKAQGNPEKLETAKKAIVWTIIGATIILGASALSYAIKNTVDEIKRDTVQSSYIIEFV